MKQVAKFRTFDMDITIVTKEDNEQKLLLARKEKGINKNYP